MVVRLCFEVGDGVGVCGTHCEDGFALVCLYEMRLGVDGIGRSTNNVSMY